MFEIGKKYILHKVYEGTKAHHDVICSFLEDDGSYYYFQIIDSRITKYSQILISKEHYLNTPNGIQPAIDLPEWF